MIVAYPLKYDLYLSQLSIRVQGYNATLQHKNIESKLLTPKEFMIPQRWWHHRLYALVET